MLHSMRDGISVCVAMVLVVLMVVVGVMVLMVVVGVVVLVIVVGVLCVGAMEVVGVLYRRVVKVDLKKWLIFWCWVGFLWWRWWKKWNWWWGVL